MEFKVILPTEQREPRVPQPSALDQQRQDQGRGQVGARGRVGWGLPWGLPG